ncbi:MAG: recombinase family protein [Oscillibacter sp.]|nr:recombinase family protein [Oscillibacter sp.]MEA4993273.1 recombinase family protein [Oscillibacter sp.]MEA5144369.1 recombinase family protein [Oscillibacter sp.]
MSARTYYYARVSSRDQNLDRQLTAFRQLGADERDIITDKESGKDLNRPGYMALKQTMLRPGDTLVVKSLDRLSRSKADIKAELEYFRRLGVRVKVIELPTTMMDLPEGQDWVFDMVNNILVEVLGTMAEKERAFTRQRQAEGYAAAKAAGKKMGRPASKKPDGWDEVAAAWRAGELTATAAMQKLGLTRYAFYKMARE